MKILELKYDTFPPDLKDNPSVLLLSSLEMSSLPLELSSVKDVSKLLQLHKLDDDTWRFTIPFCCIPSTPKVHFGWNTFKSQLFLSSLFSCGRYLSGT